ncbi:MAG: ferrous iron transport protein A, partial [Saprospiraceae bacterium]|nr:ferrous iron transport protein A [Saprospiraceae bacterium]
KIGSIQSLWQLAKGERTTVAQQQPNQLIAADLWKLGILPGLEVEIGERDADHLHVSANGRDIAIPALLARKINVTR